MIVHERSKNGSCSAASPLERARDLRDALRSRISETDRLCRLPDETVADLEAAGLFRLLSPRTHGGFQMNLDDYMDVILELGRADVSVAWTANLINTNAWLLGRFFPKHIRDKVYSSPNPNGGCVLNPRKIEVRDVEGGKMIDHGIWGFNSGIYHAGWDIVAFPEKDCDGNIVDLLLGLVPISEVNILHDWDTIGVRGSGSSTVELRDVFIPSDHIVSMSVGEKASIDFPAEDELYHLPFNAAAIFLELPMLGGCDAAVEIFLSKIKGKTILHSRYADAAKSPVIHLVIGEATAKIDAAKLIARQTFRTIHENTRNRVPFTSEDTARLRRDSGLTSRLAWEGVDLLAEASGAGMMATNHPLNRIWRDVRTGSLHAAQHPLTVLEEYGRLICEGA